MPDIGDMVNNRYEVMNVLGRGGTSTVYLVTDRHIGKMLAMKVIEKRCIGALGFARSEIESMRRVSYPLIPKIIDAFSDSGNIYILSEYIRGRSLADMCRKSRLTRAAAISVMRRICEALVYLHELRKPLLYLDLKPENIIVSDDGMPHLIDFGIAGWLAGRHMAVGTKGYSPPEQYDTRAVLDARADIYSIGMTYYAIRSGIPPDPDPEAALSSISHSRHLSSYERSFLKKCCALSKEDRYSDTREVLRQINHIGSIPDRIRKTVTLATAFAALAVSIRYTAVRAGSLIKGSEAASELAYKASQYMEDGEYTPEGIGIIKTCIRSGTLPKECEQEFIFEVAMNAMLVSHDYKTAASFFDRLDEKEYPEVADYKRLCHIQSGFDYDPKEAAYVTGRLFCDIQKRAPSVMKYENLIFIANCFEYYDTDPADGVAKALSVLEMEKRELDEVINAGSSDKAEFAGMRDRVEEIIKVKQKLMVIRNNKAKDNGGFND